MKIRYNKTIETSGGNKPPPVTGVRPPGGYILPGNPWRKRGNKMGKINLRDYVLDLQKVVASITKETAEYYPGLVEQLGDVVDCIEYYEMVDAITGVIAAADITGHNIGYIDEAEALEFLKGVDGLGRAARMLAGVDFSIYQEHYHIDDNGDINTITPTVVARSIVEIVENVNY